MRHDKIIFISFGFSKYEKAEESQKWPAMVPWSPMGRHMNRVALEHRDAGGFQLKHVDIDFDGRGVDEEKRAELKAALSDLTMRSKIIVLAHGRDDGQLLNGSKSSNFNPEIVANLSKYMTFSGSVGREINEPILLSLIICNAGVNKTGNMLESAAGRIHRALLEKFGVYSCVKARTRLVTQGDNGKIETFPAMSVSAFEENSTFLMPLTATSCEWQSQAAGSKICFKWQAGLSASDLPSQIVLDDYQQTPYQHRLELEKQETNRFIVELARQPSTSPECREKLFKLLFSTSATKTEEELHQILLEQYVDFPQLKSMGKTTF